MKKRFVTVSLMSLMLSACSIGGPGSGEGGDATGDGKTVTLQFMGWEASPLETESVKNGLKRFMEAHPHVKVEYTPVPNAQYPSKLLTMLSGNAAPDVFFLGSAEYRAFQKRNVLLDLTPQFDEKYKLDDFIPSAAQIMQIDGKVYGVSSCTVSPVLFYNKQLFDKAGVPYPPSDPANAWTWDEFVDTARKLTVKDGDKIAQYGAFGFENFNIVTAQIFSNGGEMYNKDSTQSVIHSPEVSTVLQNHLDLRVKHAAAPETKMLENIGMKGAQMLQTGKVAMLAEGSFALQELAKMNFPVGVAVLPKFKEAVTHGQAHVHAASAKTKHPKEAWQLIDFLSSEDYQAQLIKEGLWMPNRKSMYTEEGIAKWHNDKVHPEGFKDLIPYFLNARVTPSALLRSNKVTAIITEEMDKYWYAGQTADQTLGSIQARSNEELARQ
ncbi:ABC transporter substrate-binding protein [Paenibacillus xerothermodurans]|uniref:Sugar ABC transporter substrate-binding protein n=1 Tax=Paenibacillus xerothermodurans TaxID=1977292 RepID=A0A2W1P025_PAEXE|nr:sugar ABC transporter substrate-binding protein [Paenibacillus xerothermodurans]PZE21082.1 sugar ABC transporter substrate-binding protein [Paenibacillus xerothermodurans]